MNESKAKYAYDRSVSHKGHKIAVRLQGADAEVIYDERLIAQKRITETGEMNLLWFKVTEDDQEATYDIAVLCTTVTRCFIGRNGQLIYSDDPSFGFQSQELR